MSGESITKNTHQYTNLNPQIRVYLRCLELLCIKYPDRKTAYLSNKEHIEKFFIDEGSVFFIDVFETSLIEYSTISLPFRKIIDSFVANGEFVLFCVIFIIIEEVDKLDLSTLHYEKAREVIAKKAKEIDTAKFIYSLLNCSAEKKSFKTTLSKIKAEEKAK